MKRITILSLVFFAGLVAAYSAQADPPGGKDVNIVNPLPLPIKGEITSTVTGDVNVVNQPTVDARQLGVWKMDSAPREAYRANLLKSLEEGTYAAPSGGLLPDVPEGKQAIIEFVSVIAVLPAGQTAPGIEIYIDGFGHWLPMTPQGADWEGRNIFVASQSLRAYLRNGVSFTLRRDDNVGSAHFEMAVSGYLIGDTE